MGALSAWTRKRKLSAAIGVTLALVALISTPSLLAWQRENEQRTYSLSNLRRLTLALQLYAQDYDGCLPLTARKQTDGMWLTWTDDIKSYTQLRSTLDNPSNPIEGTVIEPTMGFKVKTSYALNRRFYGQFSGGPFPLENLDVANQTALLVEAGPMWTLTGRETNASPRRSHDARIEYGDTMDRYRGLVPYPSTHGGRIAIAAADGHAAAVRVEHYSAADGPHDTLYGRIGGELYNWNGGHPNGEIDRPPHE
jgi:prepilin-type processing-associated H-X9-DG protein